MNLGEFEGSIRSSGILLQDCCILRARANLHSLDCSDQFRELALNPATTYRDLYLCGMETGDYNLLLRDYSYLQFTFTSKHNYRLAFYPNPFNAMSDGFTTEVESAIDDGILSFEDYAQFISEQIYDVRLPVIRFEFDARAYATMVHPAAHFHFGLHTENRWPVGRHLTPRLFSLLIAKMFYGDDWESIGSDPHGTDGFKNSLDRQHASERLNCKLLGHELFDSNERMQLHFF